MAYLAYRAYSDGGDPKVAEAEAKPKFGGPFAPVFRALGIFGYGKDKTEGQPQPVEMDDAKALLLIRSMIAAANADGENLDPGTDRHPLTAGSGRGGAG